ncbi:MAG TPA: hypothetical protein VIX86_18140 [Streptosporangiaceae bacterium]
MKVSSPVGELPFEPTALRLCGGRVEIEGVMGAWPARVVIEPADLPSLLRLVRKPAIAAAVLSLAALGIRFRHGR